MGSVKHSLSSNRGQLAKMEQELFLPVEYTSIEEILRRKRRNNPPNDYYHCPGGDAEDMEGGNHASRLSTVSTLYNAIQASHPEGDSESIHEESTSKDENAENANLRIGTLARSHKVTSNLGRQGHKHRRSSYHENIQLNNTIAAFTEVENMLKSKDKDLHGNLRQTLDKYFNDWKQNNDKVPPSSFVYSSKHLPSYLVNSIMEVFCQLDRNGTGNVCMMDFQNICEILHLGISTEEQGSKYKKKLTSSLTEPTSRNDQIKEIWTEGQQPFWDLCVNKNKQSLNTEEFRICLLEQWAAKYCKDFHNKNQIEKNRKTKDSHKSPILRRMYKKFNKKSHSTVKDKRKNKEYMNENNHNIPDKTTSEIYKPEKVKTENVLQEESTHPKQEITVLNQLINELGTLLQASDNSKICFQVQLKNEKESTIEVKQETEYKFEDTHSENFVQKLNKNKDSVKVARDNDPFDSQLNNIINQLEEECNEIHAINNERKESLVTYNDYAINNNIGQSHSNRSRTHEKHVLGKKEMELNNDMESHRKRTNSEVAEHKARTEKALTDLEKAEIEIDFLRTNVESLSSSLECKEFELMQAKASLKEARDMESEYKAKLADSSMNIGLLTDKRLFAARAKSNKGSV